MGSKLYEFTPSELQKLLDESNSYADILRKVGLCEKGRNPDTLKKIISEYGLDTSTLDANRRTLYSKNAFGTHKKITIPLEEIIIDGKHPNYHTYKLLKRLVNDGYKEYKCESCGISEWLGKPISLQLHHVDGNHKNNLIDNLMVLCPNCHSQTDSYCGKQIKEEKKRIKNTKNVKKRTVVAIARESQPPVSRDVLKADIREYPIIKVGEKYGVSDNAVRKWCDKYNLPRHSRYIKQLSDSQWEKI